MKNTLYMLNTVSGLQAQSFILTTVFGGVIIIDGGTRADSEHMLCRLREITGLSRPHVDAWILTHPHFDHADCFLELMRAHRGDFTLDKVICAFPSAQYLAEDSYGAADTVRAFYALLPFFADKFFPVTAGDKFSISGANLHFLYTPDWTIQQDKCNNSSLVVRIELAGRVLLFTGDCAAAAGERILSQWGALGMLKADICQISHHGQNGCTREFYQVVSPETALWCTPEWLWNNDAGNGPGSGPWDTLTVRAWLADMGVKKNLVMKDGDQQLSLP